jgi:hypothetical protein
MREPREHHGEVVTTDQDSWKPPELREAETRLDETVERSRELEQEVDEMDLPRQPPIAGPEDIAAIKAEAERANAPEEMRVLKRKVDAGELTWADVLEGRAFQDPDVRNALMTRIAPLTDVYQEFEEGHTLDDVLEAAGETGSLNETRTATPAPPPAELSEEDYFGEGTALQDNGTPPPPPAPVEPPPAAPPKPSPPPRRRPSADEPGDDDYFGGSPLDE